MLGNIEAMLNTLNMSYTAGILNDLLEKAREESLTCEKFLEELLSAEVKGREKRKLEKRLKQAFFPEYKTLSAFSLSEQQSLSLYDVLPAPSNIQGFFNVLSCSPMFRR